MADRATSARAGAIAAVGVLFVAFAVWSVRLVAQVDRQRDAVAANVGNLMLADAIVQEERAPSGAELGQLRATPIEDARAAIEALPDDAPQTLVASVLTRYRGAIRADNARVSRSLGQQWDALNVVVAISIVLGLLALFSLALAERRRARSERLAAELALARDRAVASDRSKTRLLADVSHELRTPMVGLVGAAEILATTELPHPDQRDSVAAIRDSAIALRSLLDDLLNLARLDMGVLDETKSDFDPRALVDRTKTVFASVARDAGVALEIEHGALPKALRGSGDRLHQILTNVTSNGIKFGRERLEVRSDWVDDVLQIVVDDDGPGIPADARARALEPFERLGTIAPGTGLGLTVSRRLAESMGGELELADSPLGGLRVVVRVPMVESDNPGWAIRSQINPPDRRGRVLVVDDNAVNRQVLAKMVMHFGHEVWVAENGARAIERVRKSAPDLVLMDLHMPGIDGFEATRELRQTLKYTKRIVAITAAPGADTREKAHAAGIDAVMGKPITLAELELVLRQNVARVHRRHRRPA